MTKMPPKARETPLVVLHVARAPHTGVWSVIKTLATAQQSAGAVVYLGLFLPLDWPYHDELAHLGVPFFTGTSPGIFGTAAFAYHTLRPGCLRSWIAQVQRTHPGALVAVHYHNAWLSGAFLSPRLSASSVRQIATFHGVAGQSQLCKQPVRRFIHRAWAQRLLRAKCILTSVDTQNLETARELFGLPPTEFHIIPNGVRTLPMPRRRPLENGLLTVGFVGIIDEPKGWRLAADAVEALNTEFVGVSLVIAGRGPEESLARRWCEDRPRFSRFLGYVPDAGRNLMPSLDVFCLPSRTEGLPMAMMEAMAAGAVVIATGVGGIPAIIQDGRNGFIVRRNATEIRTLITRLVANPRLLSDISSEAIRTITEKYTCERIAKRYMDLYRTPYMGHPSRAA